MDGRALETGWRLAICDPGAAATPADAAALEWIPAQVPGTAAQALIDAGRWSWDEPVPLDARDVWYACEISGDGPHRLTFEGLATFAGVWLDEAPLFQSDNMFRGRRADVDLRGTHRLSIRFGPIAENVVGRKGRARWRPRMIQPSELRFVRTSALGRMPGFAPPAPPVGPWRAVRIEKLDRPRIVDKRIAARLTGDDGAIELRVTFDRAPFRAPRVKCEGAAATLTAVSPTEYAGELRLANVRKWFPHTHGAPDLYSVTCETDDGPGELARVGFRSIEIDRDADGQGFALEVNGVPVFCRGAVWTQLDPASLQNDPGALARTIALARAAGVNMFRVGGTGVYEADDFYRACDEAGILVWQDFMFSNFDYPAGDPDFVGSVEGEAREFLRRTRASPCLAVLCGGNEVYQQAAMMGVAESFWRSPLFEDILPRVCAGERDELTFLPSSPCGGALPFQADAGMTHYYGVGAYRRPLEDARRANVRFASECLGFANVPEAATLHADFGERPLSSPLWTPRIPRDQGAAQDFEEVRDHYMALLYGVDPLRLKTSDPQRYLDLSRACVAEVVEATVGEWRRPQSPCRGALIWFWKDLWASSGWGALDWRGRPKSPWYALRRVCKPAQILVSDEGVNGLHVHCLNETAAPFRGTLALNCWKDGATPVMSAKREIGIAPRGSTTLRDGELWGAFFDTAYAYRFGPPSHEVTRAALFDAQGALVSESWHFPLGRPAALFAPQLAAEAFEDADGWALRISADRFAQSVKIEDRALTPLDNWAHLAPGEQRIVRFMAGETRPEGLVAALGGAEIHYRA
jgi:beta-mannosidase